MNNIKLATRLKELRELKGITQVELAKAIGLTKQSINGIERDSKGTSLENLIKIAEYFNVTLDYLVGRDLSEVIVNKGKTYIIELINKTTVTIMAESIEDVKRINSLNRLPKNQINSNSTGWKIVSINDIDENK